MPSSSSGRSAVFTLVLAACAREPVQALPDPTQPARSDSGRAERSVRAVPSVPVVRDAGAAIQSAAELSPPIDDDACVIESHGHAAAGWSIVGFRPGPTLRDVIAIDRRRMAAVTRRRVCTSDDAGGHWTERLETSGARDTIAIERIDTDGALLVTVRRPAGSAVGSGEIAQAFVSTDGMAETWRAMPLPAAARSARAVFTDGLARIFAATGTRLFETDDLGENWTAGRVLPGSESRELDACGPTLVARARVDDDWFYHRSFDRGATWRPFRMGAIGVEGNAAMLRCITERGGIEAGRGPLPMHWTWDGGNRWSTAPYDATAQRAARALGDNADPAELPHCMGGPGDGMIACVDSGRVRLMQPSGGRMQEIHGPSTCAHVTQIDGKRTVAYGDDCGFYYSGDRGGLWSMVTQSSAVRTPGTYADGHGGFIDARTAWRLDGGIWWTFDGGAHWRPYFSIGGRALDRGVFVSRLRGVFATNTGWVTATRDGGRTWTFIVRGDVERIASSRRTVAVTTTQSVRVSPDGGVRWLAAGALPPRAALDPTVEVVGNVRSITLAPGVRVSQSDGRIEVSSPTHGTHEIARGLPRGYNLLAAHGNGREVDRVLLDGGVIIAAHSAGQTQTSPRVHERHARRTPRRVRHRSRHRA